MVINKKILFILSAIIFVILLFVSTDSYLHGLYGKSDSSVFFMCGKAWMNGYTPYSEISDSKGPLLWLIYGLGYLLSKTDFTGVFWLTVISYLLTFIYAYRIISIFVKNSNLAFIATLSMGLSYFNICVHNIIRSEDFCQLFIIISLYTACKTLYGKGEDVKHIKHDAFAVGFCIACTLLIKFTVTMMLMVFALFMLFICSNKRVMVKWGCLGMCSVIIPFIVYFLVIGCFYDFVFEYFLRTMHTVDNTMGNGARALLYPNVAVFTLIMFASVLLFSFQERRLPQKYLFPIVSFLWFLLVTIQNAWNYYFNTLSVFFVFGIIAVARLLENSTISFTMNVRKTSWLCVLIIIMIIIPPIKLVPTIRDSFLLKDNVESDMFDMFATKIKTRNKPRIQYFGSISHGLDVPAEGLPASRYPFPQTGQTYEMRKIQLNAVKHHMADFLILPRNDNGLISFAQENGYIRCLNAEYHGLYLYQLK